MLREEIRGILAAWLPLLQEEHQHALAGTPYDVANDALEDLAIIAQLVGLDTEALSD